MKIKLSELRQLIKSVITESLLTESVGYPIIGGAPELFIYNGYTETKNQNPIIELTKGDVTVILNGSNSGNTIQVNTKNKNGNVIKFTDIDDRYFKIATITLGLERTPSQKD